MPCHVRAGQEVQIRSLPRMPPECGTNDWRRIGDATTNHDVSSMFQSSRDPETTKASLCVGRPKFPLVKLLACAYIFELMPTRLDAIKNLGEHFVSEIHATLRFKPRVFTRFSTTTLSFAVSVALALVTTLMPYLAINGSAGTRPSRKVG